MATAFKRDFVIFSNIFFILSSCVLLAYVNLRCDSTIFPCSEFALLDCLKCSSRTQSHGFYAFVLERLFFSDTICFQILTKVICTVPNGQQSVFIILLCHFHTFPTKCCFGFKGEIGCFRSGLDSDVLVYNNKIFFHLSDALCVFVFLITDDIVN